MTGRSGSSPSTRTAILTIGTRPEAIKLAPVALAMRERGRVLPLIVTTGQHGDVVEDVLDLFDITPTLALRIPRRPKDGLARLYADLLLHLDRAMADLQPDAVIVQGDTASVLSGAQAAFLRGIPVVHVEAGLRSGSLAAPFPEEGNRRMVAAFAALHLAPTVSAQQNLLAEGHSPAKVIVTGNTVVDALHHAAGKPGRLPAQLERALAGSGRVVVVTAHRRESWGEGMGRIAAAVRALASSHRDTTFVVVTHMNPSVRSTFETELADVVNVCIAPPLMYAQFARLLANASLVLTDSGGVQEEAPALGVPVLVMRDRTERNEGIEAGVATLVGTETDRIVGAAEEILGGHLGGVHRAVGKALYGDGRAGQRSAEALEWLLGCGDRPEPFRADHDLASVPAST